MSKHLRYMRHRLRHWLCLQPVQVVTEWWGEELWVGAQCVICGEVTDAGKTRVRR
jgi:hypothetical protein